MEMFRNIGKVALAVMLCGVVAACGGGGGGGDESVSENSSTITGTVADGYLVKAEVFADYNNNLVWDEGEPKVSTNQAGQYTLTGDFVDQNNIVVRAIPGVTIDLDNPTVPVEKEFILSAMAGNTGFISPVTTMLRQFVQVDWMTPEDAEAKLRNLLVVDANRDIYADYIQNGDTEIHGVAKEIVNAMTVAQGIVGENLGDEEIAAQIHRLIMDLLSEQSAEILYGTEGFFIDPYGFNLSDVANQEFFFFDMTDPKNVARMTFAGDGSFEELATTDDLVIGDAVYDLALVDGKSVIELVSETNGTVTITPFAQTDNALFVMLKKEGLEGQEAYRFGRLNKTTDFTMDFLLAGPRSLVNLNGYAGSAVFHDDYSVSILGDPGFPVPVSQREGYGDPYTISHWAIDPENGSLIIDHVIRYYRLAGTDEMVAVQIYTDEIAKIVSIPLAETPFNTDTIQADPWIGRAEGRPLAFLQENVANTGYVFLFETFEPNLTITRENTMFLQFTSGGTVYGWDKDSFLEGTYTIEGGSLAIDFVGVEGTYYIDLTWNQVVEGYEADPLGVSYYYQITHNGQLVHGGGPHQLMGFAFRPFTVEALAGKEIYLDGENAVSIGARESYGMPSGAFRFYADGTSEVRSADGLTYSPGPAWSILTDGALAFGNLRIYRPAISRHDALTGYDYYYVCAILDTVDTTAESQVKEGLMMAGPFGGVVPME